MDSLERLAWAGGLFEGEDSFYMSGEQATAALKMTDEEPVRRFHEIVGVGHVYLVDENKRQPNRKSYWAWQASKASEFERVVNLLWAWLGPRRQTRARECLDLNNKRPRIKLWKERGESNA